jgi:hypothetical protein
MRRIKFEVCSPTYTFPRESTATGYGPTKYALVPIPSRKDEGSALLPAIVETVPEENVLINDDRDYCSKIRT